MDMDNRTFVGKLHTLDLDLCREKEGALLCTAAKLTIQLIFLGKWKKIVVREELEAGRKLPRWTNARQYFVGCQKSC